MLRYSNPFLSGVQEILTLCFRFHEQKKIQTILSTTKRGKSMALLCFHLSSCVSQIAIKRKALFRSIYFKRALEKRSVHSFDSNFVRKSIGARKI